jgi:hypothetical protein
VNGEFVDWTRAAGWMCTCPVLILFLVSMTTFGGREASVRVVPLYARATRAQASATGATLRFAHFLTPTTPMGSRGSRYLHSAMAPVNNAIQVLHLKVPMPVVLLKFRTESFE